MGFAYFVRQLCWSPGSFRDCFTGRNPLQILLSISSSSSVALNWKLIDWLWFRFFFFVQFQAKYSFPCFSFSSYLCVFAFIFIYNCFCFWLLCLNICLWVSSFLCCCMLCVALFFAIFFHFVVLFFVFRKAIIFLCVGCIIFQSQTDFLLFLFFLCSRCLLSHLFLYNFHGFDWLNKWRETNAKLLLLFCKAHQIIQKILEISEFFEHFVIGNLELTKLDTDLLSWRKCIRLLPKTIQ